jgi:tetratricopeptide (TPR) repeat protein
MAGRRVEEVRGIRYSRRKSAAMPSSEELYDQAVDCIAEGKLDEAIDKYKEAVALDPSFADAWEGLSMALADKELWDEAIAAAQKVVALNPSEQLGYTNVSRIYQRAGNVPEAEAWAAKARVLDWKQQLKEGKS